MIQVKSDNGKGVYSYLRIKSQDILIQYARKNFLAQMITISEILARNGNSFLAHKTVFQLFTCVNKAYLGIMDKNLLGNFIFV